MWQEIAVFIIGLIVIFYIGKKIYKFFTHPIRNRQSLSKDVRGCAIKEQNPKQLYLTSLPKNKRFEEVYYFAILYR